MKRHWAYLKYVLIHKYWVLVEGLKLGVPLWSLILHDWHKFLPDEWLPYARCFYTASGGSQYEPTDEFWAAWNRHQKRAKHHWQYWLLTMDKGNTIPLPMPDRHRREMLADWHSFAHTKDSDTRMWYLKQPLVLNPETKRLVELQLGIYP